MTHPTQSHPSTQREKQGKKPPSQERKLLFACFVAVLVTWMSFASGGRELSGGVLSMLETHIVMSSLMFCLSLILVFCLARTLVLLLTLSHVPCLALLLVLRLSSLMDPTIAHMVLIHERTALGPDALVTVHVLIVVTVSHVGLVFPLEGPFPTLSRDT
jgi:flagellar biosynthesis protein FlhB